MDRRHRTKGLILVLAGLLLAGGSALAAGKQKRSGTTAPTMYKWVDENGVTHYGDQVPARYATQDREVLNQQGVAVRREEGTPDVAAAAAAEQAAAQRQATEERDQVLLSTYLSVEEIEALRDRRLDLMDGQIKLTENYLTGLRGKLKELQSEASSYQPYSSDPAAAPIDEKLAGELADTMDSIARYEKTLMDTRTKRQQLTAEFAADIERFRELKAATPR